MRISFGEYAQVLITDTSLVKNSMQPRTEGAIALLPVGNLQGSVKFYILRSKAIATKDHWKALPMPPAVIDHLNAFTPIEQLNKSKADMRFYVGYRESELKDDNENDFFDDVRDADLRNIVVDPPLKMSGNGIGNIIEMDPEHGSNPETVSTPPSNIVVADVLPGNNGQITKETNMIDENNDDGSVSEDSESSSQEHVDKDNNDLIPQEVPLHGHLTRARFKYPKDSHLWEYGIHVVFAMMISKVYYDVCLMSVKQAFNRYGDKAKEAAAKELRQLHEKDVWIPIGIFDRKQCTNIIPSHMIIVEKFNPDGSHDKIKARFLAGGNHELQRLYEDNHSSTVNLVVVFINLSIVVRGRRYIRIVDIAGAYLNALIKNKKIFMRIDKQIVKILMEMFPELYNESTVGPDGSVIVLLLKALYGCRESAKLWYEHLRRSLESLGFTVNPYDVCVFNKICSGTGKQITVAVYVDDLLITSESLEDINNFIEELIRIYKNVTVKEDSNLGYLGMEISFTNINIRNEIEVKMTGYVNELLEDMNEMREVSTPYSLDLFEIDSNAELLSLSDKEKFHSTVARVMYLAKRVRPDLLTTCSFLASRVNHPTIQDQKKLNRMIRYLAHTKDLGIRFCHDGSSDMQLEMHIDASYASHSDRKGQSAVSIMLGGSPVFVRSIKQII